jgi:hypothetical protein
LPGWLENAQVRDHACVPAFRAWIRDLGGTDEHRDIVSPCRHLTGNLRSVDGEAGNGGSERAILPKVGYGSVKDILQILTELVITLCKHRNGKKTKAQDGKCPERFHIDSKPIAKNGLELANSEDIGGFIQAVKSCLAQIGLSTRFCRLCSRRIGLEWTGAGRPGQSNHPRTSVSRKTVGKDRSRKILNVPRPLCSNM